MKKVLNKEMRKFNYLIGEINAAYHDAAVKFHLSDSAVSVIYTICSENRTLSLSEICRLSGISKQTINSAVRKLESENIIVLTPVDGKQKSVSLTDKGEQLAGETVAKIIDAENRIFDSWSDKERNDYLFLTQKYLDEINKEFDKF